MDERAPTCKLCGHDADEHRYAQPVVCADCPDQRCQDGPDGRAYRDREQGRRAVQ